jgi:arylsulfatase A-like enzyme
MADDLGYGDLSCYGSKVIDTPNIDSMAKGGIRFTDFHSNGAMCSPTRAALLTGRYQQRAGVESVFSCKSSPHAGVSLKEVTFAEVLKAKGYVTGMYGKWHLGIQPVFNPVRQGFDEYFGFVAGGSDYFSHINRSGEPDWWHNDKLEAEEGYTTDLLTDHAIDFINANKDKPFCAYVPYQAVHFPFQGPEDEADRVIGGSYWSKAKYGRRYLPGEDRKLAYKEMVESMDANVGRILETLKKLGLEQNTLVFFTSDNGAYSWVGSNAPLSGQKSSLLEGGHRVPAVAYWPGKIKAGSVTDATTITMDIYPTMAALAGAKAPDGLKLDGVDISTVLLKNGNVADRTLYWRTSRQGAVRQGKYKLLVERKKGKKIRLFDLEADIAEKNDLSQSKPELMNKLLEKYHDWEKDVEKGVTWVRK